MIRAGNPARKFLRNFTLVFNYNFGCRVCGQEFDEAHLYLKSSAILTVKFALVFNYNFGSSVSGQEFREVVKICEQVYRV